eukprot:TRINITY_DN3933_c0_g1_i2.p1 TRINITY_DN3933_c0_g1~~TRINITY_DN3933_c0_g1_i2.p1  ORF type:complete len:501 (-),score=58.85 TRINITY_DN3933_c0_g1_i2:819-2321(-)
MSRNGWVGPSTLRYLLLALLVIVLVYTTVTLLLGQAISGQTTSVGTIPRTWHISSPQNAVDSLVLALSTAGKLSRIPRTPYTAQLQASRLYLQQHLPFKIYRAGAPQFMRYFARDSLMYGILSSDMLALKHSLAVASLYQGMRTDFKTGEQPGKIPHEVPGVNIGRFNTQYNACDTSGIYLSAAAHYLSLPGADADFIAAIMPHIELAVNYIIGQVDDRDLFTDRPVGGAARYALEVTYWKDSVLPRGRHPDYPVVYTVAHCQAAKGLTDIAPHLSQSHGLLAKHGAQRMYAAVSKHLVDITGAIIEGLDATGPITTESSDALYALAYLPPRYCNPEMYQRIRERAQRLETAIGYRTARIPRNGMGPISYHAGTIWPIEQVMITRGALAHGLPDVAGVARRMYRALKALRGVPSSPQYPEIIILDEGVMLQRDWWTDLSRYYSVVTLATDADSSVPSTSTSAQGSVRIRAAGCHTQLWTVGAWLWWSREEETLAAPGKGG